LDSRRHNYSPFRGSTTAKYSARLQVSVLVWLLLAGWWLAVGHLITAIALAVTIIGIPFAWAHLKLAGMALWPIGKTIVLATPLRYPPQR